MTKQKKNLLILVLIIFVGVLIYYFFSKKEIMTVDQKSEKDQSQKNSMELTIQGRRLLNPPKNLTKEKIKKIVPVNPPKESWKEGVEQTLRLQGGDAITKLEIKKAESFVWLVDGGPLNVESVVIRIQNEKKEETIFRALVDSSSGKILHTWDQPIVDPVNPRKKFKVKIDPRYFEDAPEAPR